MQPQNRITNPTTIDIALIDEEIKAGKHVIIQFSKATYKLRSMNMNYIQYSRALINENKWRAGRYGIEGKLIDFGKEEEVTTRFLILELLDFIDDVVDELGSRHRLKNVTDILDNGTGADRQLAVYEKTKNLVEVAKYIRGQFLYGVR